MPSTSAEANRRDRKKNYNRRSRAYAYLKMVAQREGWMRHQNDGDGFDKFMDSLEGKDGE